MKDSHKNQVPLPRRECAETPQPFKYLKGYLKEEETGFILQTAKLQPMYRSHKKIDVVVT